MKLYILTMGKDLYYATKDFEDAKYEKEYTEEENMLGRKMNIKLTEVIVDSSKPDSEVTLSNRCTYKVEDILNLL